MKHNHRGRILTQTVSLKSDKLTRLPSGPSEGSLPPIQPTGAAAGTQQPVPVDGISRVQILERENEKLRLSLSEVERSVTNYRSLLNPTRGGPARQSVSTQTTQALPPHAVQTSFTSAENDPEKRMGKLEKVNVQLTRRIEDLNRTVDDANTTIKRISADNTMLIEQIEKNNEKSSQRNEQAAAIDHSRDLKIRIADTATGLRGSVDCLKSEILNLRSLSEEWMVEFKINFSEIKSAVNRIVVRPPTPPPAPATFDTGTSISPIKSPIKGDDMDTNTNSIATSPVRWPAATIELVGVLAGGAGACVPSPPPSLSGGLPAMQADQETMSVLNAEDSKALVDLSVEDIPSEMTTSILVERVRTFAEDVKKAYRVEINAVKHTAHCKDLSRLAAQRELALERDRACIELKHARYT
jgi:hypothetical protein